MKSFRRKGMRPTRARDTGLGSPITEDKTMISNQKKTKALNAIEAGLTISQAATKFGVSEGTISRWKAAPRTTAAVGTRTRRPAVLNTSANGLARENQILRGIVGQQLVEQLLKTH